MTMGMDPKRASRRLQRYRAWVIAVGGCALDGGLYRGSYACVGGVGEVIPVDLHIPGCPPSPKSLLKGLLALMRQRKPSE